MTDRAARPSYTIGYVGAEFRPGDAAAPWAGIPPLRIGHYLWLANDHRPQVDVRLCRSRDFLHVHFQVGESRVRARYTEFQDPVYKDSCVEFFIDAFPETKQGYVNFETNALGTLLAAFGPDRSHRRPLLAKELEGFDAVSSIPGPVDGEYGAGEWTLEYRIPLALFRKAYGCPIEAGRRAAGNFFKCGDETEIPHYGAWSRVDAPRPDFHRPEFFGEIIFA